MLVCWSAAEIITGQQEGITGQQEGITGQQEIITGQQEGITGHETASVTGHQLASQFHLQSQKQKYLRMGLVGCIVFSGDVDP